MSGLSELLRRPGSVLLCGPRTWADDADALVLHDPAGVLVARAPGEVPALLEAVEAQQRAGRFVAGLVCYEAGAAFGLPTHPAHADLPLAWMAAYRPEHVIRAAADQLRPPGEQPGAEVPEPELAVSEAQYRAAIARIQGLIAAGDTYQVNFTVRARFASALDPLAYFLAMRRAHPVPYAAWIDTGEAQVLSLSPELLLRRRAGVLTGKPMKGTRPRGRTPEEDEALARELVTAEKDRAENLMIVDMVRNDLGRVCRVGSVRVPELFAAERYATLWQMTSKVTGEQAPGVTLAEVFAAVFPGASITGAPKHRTMEIIRELEAEPRGVYCGAVGLFAPGGDFTCGLPIRTLVHRGGRFELGIGAGIVADSDPRGEYEETLLKAEFARRVGPELRLFETLLLDEHGRWRFEREHLERLGRSAAYWGFAWDAQAARAALSALAESAPGPLVARLELAREGGLALHPREAPEPAPGAVTVLVSARRTDAADRYLYHKTSRRALYDEERARAVADGYFEVIFRNAEGHVTEGAITNVFVRVGERWLTPPITDGLLPGIWRAAFLRETGARERSLTFEDLLDADEVVIGNSVRGAVRVGRIVVE